jgi:hypothetical protein
MWIKNTAMPVARNDIAPSLQLRRAPVMPMTLRNPKSRVLQISRSPHQLSLFTPILSAAPSGKPSD